MLAGAATRVETRQQRAGSLFRETVASEKADPLEHHHPSRLQKSPRNVLFRAVALSAEGRMSDFSPIAG